MPEIASLPLFHQIAGQSVLVLGDGEAAEPKRRLVERAGGIVVDDQIRAIDEGVRLAFVAYDDAKACEVAAINLRCAGMLVNVVDRPDLCDFTTPSILDRDPLLIAVGTGGASAGLAKHIRLRLDRILPQSLGALATALKRLRPHLREKLPDGGDRRRAIDAALREGGPLDPMNADAHLNADAWAQGLPIGSRNIADQQPACPDPLQSGAAAQIADFTLASQDPEDLTLQQARFLGEADIVCAHGSIGPDILARARADAVRVQCDRGACPRARGSNDEPACLKKQNDQETKCLTVILREPFEG